MLAILSFRVWQSVDTRSSSSASPADTGEQRQVLKHGRARFHLWEMNSGATRSLFSLSLGRLNHLLYKPGKLFISGEVKVGGGRCCGRGAFFFFSLFLARRLRSAKNKQVGAFVQRCNLHINYPAELISTSAYPRYLSAHTCSTLSSH